MRKDYIGWWVVSAVLFFMCLNFLYGIIRYPEWYRREGFTTCAAVFIASLVCLYIGYRRFQEYKEYQEDRRIRNEFYQSNTKHDDK